MQIDSLQKSLGYTFSDTGLLSQALTHSSYANEHNNDESCNERLEFLGDAVLELLISDFLFRQNVALSEGALTQRRAGLVWEPSLANLARQLSLGKYLLLGHGEEASGGRERDSLLADAFEAVTGAIYLDGGFEAAQAFARKMFDSLMNKQSNGLTDYKTRLQEYIQRTSREPVVYDIVDEAGPPHQKTFTASVSHQRELLGTGTGKNKKEAEQNAAMDAMKKNDFA